MEPNISTNYPPTDDDLFEWESYPQCSEDTDVKVDVNEQSVQLLRPQRLGSSHYEENAIVKALRVQTNNLYTRLLSIEHDTRRAMQLYASLLKHSILPLFGNARAGAWYVPPSHMTEFPVSTCSFKSADGHYGVWAASPRRPNMHVLEAIVRHGGVVIVDVTRAGKRIPDALSKTIPIWCAVLNILIFHPDDCANAVHANSFLHIHPSIPASEQAAIAARIPAIATAWRHAGIHMLPLLALARKQNLRELRPLWTAPSRPTWSDGLPVDQLEFAPILCISASDAVAPEERPYVDAATEISAGGINFPRRNGFPYVQGAGDDEEAWAHGLSPQLFWQTRDVILDSDGLEDAPTTEQALQNVIQRVKHILNQCRSEGSVGCPPVVLPVWRSLISIARISQATLVANLNSLRGKFGPFGAVIALTGPLIGEERNESETNTSKQIEDDVHIFELKTYRGATDTKYGLERVLGPCLDILRSCCVDRRERALICCTSPTGDWTAGLAISWLLWHCIADRDSCDTESPGVSATEETADAPGFRVCTTRRENIQVVDKDEIQAMMVRFLSTSPGFQISRATFKQITRFFMSLSPKSLLPTT